MAKRSTVTFRHLVFLSVCNFSAHGFLCKEGFKHSPTQIPFSQTRFDRHAASNVH